MDHVCIIAEAGVNHNGDFQIAKKMVDVAKDAGVDYIKFQTFVPKKLVSKYAQKAKYQKKVTSSGETQLQMLQKLTLTNENFCALKDYCQKVGIGFLSTPFDSDSIRFLETLDLPFWKVSSGEITNFPHLCQLARTKKPIILSTGMSTMEEITQAIQVLKKHGTTEIILLHCNTEYPTPFCDVNLSAMRTIADTTGLPVGYSDHTEGIEVPVAAVALGARMIEKHFTLDKNMEGPDHRASLSPDELKAMVDAIRHIEQAMGSGRKEPSASEKENISAVRKSIVAKRYITQGEVFTEENLTTKRPGNGISPMEWENILGQRAQKDYEEDELIQK